VGNFVKENELLIYQCIATSKKKLAIIESIFVKNN